MAWSDQLSSLSRGDKRSITQQLVDLIASAIATGELQPGERLPPIRKLAARAGVNQLTAARAYRRLQDMGLLIASVGRGTFVRSAPIVEPKDGEDDCSWQIYALAQSRTGKGPRLLAASVADGVVPFSLGSFAEELIPVAELAAAGTDALRAATPSTYAYAAVQGQWELREQLAALAADQGYRDAPDQIVVTTGASQALMLAARAVLRPGDVAACESPSFAGIIDALQAAGARVLPVPLDERGLRIDALESMLRSTEIKLLALQPRLQNPTGYDLERERALTLLELAQRHNFFVVEDGVYAPLRFDGDDPGPLRPLDPARVIHVNSLSKTLSPGLRIGWLAASGPVLDRIVAEKHEADMASPTLPQQMAARYLAAGRHGTQVARATAVYRERRDVLLAALEREMAGLARWTHPAGGGHLWLTLRRARSEAPLHRTALAAGVSYLPGSAALVEPPEATHMRISFGACPVELIPEGVRRLAAAIRSQPQATNRDARPAA